MNPERWRRISEVTASAMELGGEERAAFLKEACGSDEELRQEVERLLREDEQAGSFMQKPAIAGAVGRFGQMLGHRRVEEKTPHTLVQKDVWRRPTPSEKTRQLPPEMLQGVGQRLRLAALVYAFGYFSAHALMIFIDPSHGSTGPNLCALVFITVSLGVYALAKWAHLNPPTLINLGLVFEVVGSFGIGIMYGWTNFEEIQMWGISWICVWVVAYPLIVPSIPRQATVAAFSSAAMGPLALLLWVWMANVPAPSLGPIAAMSLPNFICAALASFGSRMIYKMGTELDQARRMGSYRLEKLLGRGGMGEVWLARHQMLARPAAIKLVRPEFLGHDGGSRAALRRFEREAQAIAALSSPHTVELYDFGTTDESTFYYVMELLDGLDLDSLIKRFGPVGPGRAIHFLKQVCLSLAEAHHRGLVHRDIKPANIYACRLGLEHDFIKVLDFGLVKPKQSSQKDITRLTMDTFTVGTPGYMAPETAMGGEVDARTDLYSLGCAGYWLITGQLVFEGTKPLQIVMDHIQTAPVPPSQRTELEIPKKLDEVILWCLEKDPANRPASAQKLADQLDVLAQEYSWSQERAQQWWRQHLPTSLLES
ncbi:serine/threonine protein kinase [Acidobacteria bacterium AH-259-D05]|nr:serine/threonine protein kinase [Acidobacteria bacterium AH-259-D05]